MNGLIHNWSQPGTPTIKPGKNLINKEIYKMSKTNSQLGQELGVTSRQISKSRRRGWIWKDGKKKNYTAPPPVSITLEAIPKKTKNMKAVDESSESWQDWSQELDELTNPRL